MLDFRNKLILAPMAGVTDHAFRRLCILHGADYTVTEMISAKALTYMDAKTAALAKIFREESPIAIQIFGSDPEIMGKAAGMLSRGEYRGCESEILPAAIDINMGCPVHKIVSNGEGSALMKDPGRAYEIVCAVVENSAVPVTVKMRAGFDAQHVNAVEVALATERAGASAICIHGRTRDQMYRPPVDYEIIRRVKEALRIPVVGNGEIMRASDAVLMKEKTGCDALMIARGALGNPFIFREIRAAFDGATYTPPSREEKLTTALVHLSLLVEDKGEHTGFLEARKHVAWYIKGMPGAPAMRDAINRAEDLKEMDAIIREALARSRGDTLTSL